MEDFNIKDLVDTMTGTDENGNPKAMVTLQHQMLFLGDDDIETEIIDETMTSYAVLGLNVSGGMTTALLKFNSFDDIDFIRMHTVCKNYETREFGERTEMLVLTMIDLETYTNVVSMVVELVSFDGAEPIVRLMANSDNTRAFMVDPEDVDPAEFDEDLDEDYIYLDEDFEDYK